MYSLFFFMLRNEFLPSRVSFNTTISPCGVTHLYTSDYLPTPIFVMTSFNMPRLINVCKAK